MEPVLLILPLIPRIRVGVGFLQMVAVQMVVVMEEEEEIRTNTLNFFDITEFFQGYPLHSGSNSPISKQVAIESTFSLA